MLVRKCQGLLFGHHLHVLRLEVLSFGLETAPRGHSVRLVYVGTFHIKLNSSLPCASQRGTQISSWLVCRHRQSVVVAQCGVDKEGVGVEIPTTSLLMVS